MPPTILLVRIDWNMIGSQNALKYHLRGVSRSGCRGVLLNDVQLGDLFQRKPGSIPCDCREASYGNNISRIARDQTVGVFDE